jgi:hypothetical protein
MHVRAHIHGEGEKNEAHIEENSSEDAEVEALYKAQTLAMAKGLEDFHLTEWELMRIRSDEEVKDS